jgi:UDP-2,4-diacetamido-2,4,6-trideoxy-beta-L-altropyranose hydrolase
MNNTLKIIFRTDASIQIGTGHVMRCLTLADELTRQGHQCWFICREHPGHLGDVIASKGYGLTLLPAPPEEQLPQQESSSSDDYARWLGVPWQEDANQTLDAISPLNPDWLVVDHYTLDAQWERTLSSAVDKIMVIDDLANRPHECTLLLDQTFGRSVEDYQPWVSDNCQLLCGSQYALLRPEFAELRPYSLQRRSKPELRQLLIAMGGVDKDNVTGQVLDVLRNSDLPADCNIIVVMGVTAPWLESIKQQAQTLPWHTDVKVGVSNMAQLMADSDLAIGAAGATSWERCCLGLPTVMIVLADNQRTIARNLYKAGAAKCIDTQNINSCPSGIFNGIDLEALSKESQKICDGRGTAIAARWMDGT